MVVVGPGVVVAGDVVGGGTVDIKSVEKSE